MKQAAVISLELCKKIRNYFIDNNHTNYILIISICNNQNI